MPCSLGFRSLRFVLVSVVLFTGAALAADAPKPPDVVTFVNGEHMSGKLVKVAGGKVFFHSDMVGDVSFDWAKVKELKTATPYVVIGKDTKLKRHQSQAVPEGTIVASDSNIDVSGAKPATVPTAQAAYVIEQPAFEKEMERNPGFLSGWMGAVTAGVSLVEATQNSESFTSAITAVRQSPGVDWMKTNSRTTFDFSNSYGQVTQPGTPTVKTSIFHADGEQDEYFTDKVYGLAHAAFDHNFSQGLDLQQLYGGGLGYTALKDKVQELDLKADVHYEKQQFASAADQNLIGSDFAENYLRKLPRGMVLTQGLLYDPAWNNTTAYSAQAMLGLAAPFSKKFSLSINLMDGFLNNPPPGFKKNSFQFTTGITYTMK